MEVGAPRSTKCLLNFTAPFAAYLIIEHGKRIMAYVFLLLLSISSNGCERSEWRQAEVKYSFSPCSHSARFRYYMVAKGFEINYHLLREVHDKRRWLVKGRVKRPLA